MDLQPLLQDLFDTIRTTSKESLLAFLAQNPSFPIHSPDPETGNTALHYASANGSCEIMRILLQRDAPVNATNAQGNTPCHWACLNNQLEAVKMLCEAGADPFLENAFGRSAVEEAAFYGHEAVLAFITALYEAAAEGQEIE